jgi:hypothetical protein
MKLIKFFINICFLFILFNSYCFSSFALAPHCQIPKIHLISYSESLEKMITNVKTKGNINEIIEILNNISNKEDFISWLKTDAFNKYPESIQKQVLFFIKRYSLKKQINQSIVIEKNVKYMRSFLKVVIKILDGQKDIKGQYREEILFNISDCQRGITEYLGRTYEIFLPEVISNFYTVFSNSSSDKHRELLSVLKLLSTQQKIENKSSIPKIMFPYISRYILEKSKQDVKTLEFIINNLFMDFFRDKDRDFSRRLVQAFEKLKNKALSLGFEEGDSLEIISFIFSSFNVVSDGSLIVRNYLEDINYIKDKILLIKKEISSVKDEINGYLDEKLFDSERPVKRGRYMVQESFEDKKDIDRVADLLELDKEDLEVHLKIKENILAGFRLESIFDFLKVISNADDEEQDFEISRRDIITWLKVLIEGQEAMDDFRLEKTRNHFNELYKIDKEGIVERWRIGRDQDKLILEEINVVNLYKQYGIIIPEKYEKYKDYTVEITDDSRSLFLVQDYRHTCLTVTETDLSYSQNIMGFCASAKMKIIIVRDINGNIHAVSILRILKNIDTNKIECLLDLNNEQLFYKKLILLKALAYTNKLGVNLVVNEFRHRDVFLEEEFLIKPRGFTGKLQSFGNAFLVEYVDVLKRTRTDGTYIIENSENIPLLEFRSEDLSEFFYSLSFKKSA